MFELKIMNEERIYKFLRGELDPEERELFFKWLNQDALNMERFHEIKKAWALSQTANDKELFDPQKEFELHRYRMQVGLKNNKTLTMYKTLLRIAAVLILVLGTTAILKLRPDAPKIQGNAFNEITTNAGEKTKITLADGSQIWINACSKLKYPSNLNSEQVHVYLEGEAYFDIKKIKGRMMVVHTSDINVNVLGTAFNVRAYRDEDIIEATLVRGQIAIEKNGKTDNKHVLLEPSQSASFVKNGTGTEPIMSEHYVSQRENIDKTREIASRKHTNIVVAQNFNPEVLIAWKDGLLSFKNEPFELLSKRLERWYDMKIVIAGEKLKKARFTGTFDKETIEQALTALSYPVPFKYKIVKDSVFIEPR